MWHVNEEANDFKSIYIDQISSLRSACSARAFGRAEGIFLSFSQVSRPGLNNAAPRRRSVDEHPSASLTDSLRASQFVAHEGFASMESGAV